VHWYFRFQLSLRDIEEWLFERGVVVSYQTFGAGASGMNGPPSGEDMQQNVDPHSQADGIEVPKLEDHQGLLRQIGVAIMANTIVDVNIAKNVMQIHGLIRQWRNREQTHDALRRLVANL